MEKYLDGKKVSVLQQISDTQSLVKEIYVDENGNELPHKDSFIVSTSSLSDVPLVSWKTRNLKKIEDDFRKHEKKIEEKIKREEKSLENAYKKVYHLTKSIQELASTLEKPESRLEFIRLLDFMSGAVKWVVIDGLPPEIKKFDDLNLYDNDYYGYVDRIKLISLLGDSKGNLSYKINHYSDGSGVGYSIYPFCEEHEAIEKLKELTLSKKYITEKFIETAEKYNIQLDEDLLAEYYNKQKEVTLKEIEKTKETLANYQEVLTKHQNELAKLESKIF
jgi:uncharacterized membrane-anchored protein YhcB (DUF1043 family)